MIFQGKTVHVVPDPAAIRLSTKVQVTDAFRDEFNDWLLDFFGTTPTQFILDDQLIVKDNTIFVNPRSFARLKAAIELEESKSIIPKRSGGFFQ